MKSAFVVGVITWLPRWMQCAVGLHEFLIVREPARLSLVCLHCRRQTRGLALR